MVVQVKGMGMDSPELLLLVENCPRGAETLVTRIIHILTDKGLNTVPCLLTLYGHINTTEQCTVISTLAVDGWAVTFATARRGLGGLGPHPVPSSLY